MSLIYLHIIQSFLAIKLSNVPVSLISLYMYLGDSLVALYLSALVKYLQILPKDLQSKGQTPTSTIGLS